MTNAMKKVDRSDAAIFRALKRAARAVRGDHDSGHRMSKTMRPAQCHRCYGYWPCGSERRARNFDTLAKAITATPEGQ